MNFNRILVLLSASLLLFACEDDSRVFVEGDIVGTVRLYDEFGKEKYDRSGVVVSYGYSENTATSNENGWFILESVPAGTYNFLYEKEDFWTLKTFNNQHIGGEIATVVVEQILFELPDVNINIKEITHDEIRVYVNVDFTLRSNVKLQAFLSDSPDVSWDNYSFIGGLIYPGPLSECTIDIWTSQSFLELDKIYMVIYAVNPADEPLFYYDYETGKNVFFGCTPVTELITINLN